MEGLGERLRRTRERKLMTQDQLSERSGVMKATISRIENERFNRRPYTSTLEALARVLDVSVEWLAFGDDKNGGHTG